MRKGYGHPIKKNDTLIRAAEVLKTVLLFILIVLMLVLLILLMLGQNTSRQEAIVPEERMVVYTTGAATGYAKGMQSAHMIPAMLAFREDGGVMRCLYAADSMLKPYAALYEPIRMLFGADSFCTLLDAEEGGALWERCARNGAYLYLRYQSALPPAVIRAYTFTDDESETENANLDARAQGDSVYAEEVFFVPFSVVDTDADDADEICAVTRDDAGNIAVFRYGKAFRQTRAETPDAPSVPADTEADDADNGSMPSIAAYAFAAAEPGTESAENAASAGYTSSLSVYLTAVGSLAADAQEAVFAAAAEDIPYAVSDPTAVYCGGVYKMPVLHIGEWNPETELFTGENEQAYRLLSLLGLGENDTENHYTDTNGSLVYLNADGRLLFQQNGEIRYTALQSGGIPISDYLGYASVGGSYLLSEYLRASDRLLDALASCDAALGGMDLQTALYTVRRTAEEDGGELVISYIYTMNGIPVMDENGTVMTAMTLTAADGVVRSLYLRACRAEKVTDGTDGADASVYLLPQSVLLRAMRAEAESTAAGTPDGGGAEADIINKADEATEESPYSDERGIFVMRYMRDPADVSRAAAEWVWIAGK
ncbi:MAG: hypothetical protein ACI3XM_08300 [Eubacteriales bacterium]